MFALVSAASCASTLMVGADQDITRIADAARIAKDGDTVLILPGEYRGDVAVWHQKELTIRGLGDGPVLIADGKNAEGKAIWVIRNGDFSIDNIEFRGARVEDGNGAGIRFERGRLAISRSRFIDNQMGLLTANSPEAELSITDSLFAQAPDQAAPLPHLLYVGRIARLEITGSRFHNGHHGHLVKTRARENHIRYNLILDGPGGKASYELDLPNGGIAYVVGNIIGQSDTTENPVLIAYGAEGDAWPENALYLSHNTLISDRLTGGLFLRVWKDALPADVEVTGINNLTVGLGLFTLAAPGRFSGNIPLPPWTLDTATLDFAIGENSLLRRLGKPPPEDSPLRPTAEFSLPNGTREINAPERWAPGALQRSY